MLSILKSYRKIDSNVLNLVFAEAFVQLVNASFMLLLLIYMNKCGLKDYEAAHYMKFRFLGVLVLAIPIGIYIKKYKIKPLLLFGSLAVPIAGIAIILSIKYNLAWLIYLSHVIWGIGFVCIQVTAVPFILRYAAKEIRTEAISLIHSTWSFAGIVSGIIIFGLEYLFPSFMNEEIVLLILTSAGVLAFYFALKIKLPIELNNSILNTNEKRYDWPLITLAMIPTAMIAIGAGLTIPFISLFFYKIHGVDSDHFALLSTAALIIVAYAILMVPTIKKKMGYKLAIPFTQSVSIMALIGLATTEFFNEHWIAVYMAAFFYISRQPLMNMAQPMTTEVTMAYVGEKNREMVSALTAAIWSGSWFISATVFEKMRLFNFNYSTIFIVTAGFYAIGVILYYFLTVKAEKDGKL